MLICHCFRRSKQQLKVFECCFSFSRIFNQMWWLFFAWRRMRSSMDFQGRKCSRFEQVFGRVFRRKALIFASFGMIFSWHFLDEMVLDWPTGLRRQLLKLELNSSSLNCEQLRTASITTHFSSFRHFWIIIVERDQLNSFFDRVLEWSILSYDHIPYTWKMVFECHEIQF